MSKSKPKIGLTKSELLQQLREQISFMLTSAELYDQGRREEAKRLAHQLRLLLHDTKNSKSLLGQLGLKEIHFFDTAHPLQPDNLVSSISLMVFRFENSTGMRPWLAPKGGELIKGRDRRIRFSEWWNNPVVLAKGKTKDITFCRREVILHLADMDGGSHVDGELEEEYVALSRWNAVGILVRQNGVESAIGNPIFPCVRQIAHEVLVMLEIKVPDLFPRKYIFNDISAPDLDNLPTGVPTSSTLIFGLCP